MGFPELCGRPSLSAVENRSPFRRPIFVDSKLWFEAKTLQKHVSRTCC